MRLCRSMILTAAAILTAAVCGGVHAQTYRILPRELMDSVANPVAATDSPMRFVQSRIDAGTISEDDAPSEYIFRWRNCGERPLAITGVKTSCGCVVAEYDKRPVDSGGSGQIRVTYHPKGHPGWFNRKITVYTSFSTRPSAVLELTGSVTPSAVPAHEYRHRIGPLGLKQRQVQMDGSRRCEERIEVLNTGGRELRITADSLPEYLSFGCEPEAIAPGAKADIVISFDPAKATGEVPEEVTVVLGGVEATAGDGSICVLFGKAGRQTDGKGAADGERLN